MHLPSHTRLSVSVIVRWQDRLTEVATDIIDHRVSYVPHFIPVITWSAQKCAKATFVLPDVFRNVANCRLYAHTKPLLDSFVLVFFHYISH
jgi:hypothetical protein